MSRDANGNYTLPLPPVVAGTVITAEWANTTTIDIGTEITASLDRQGRGGMLAPLRGLDGTVLAPSYAYISEVGSGQYRAAAGDVRMAILTADIMRWTAAGADLWIDGAWAPILTEGGGDIPDGTVDNQILKWLTDAWVVGQLQWGEIEGTLSDQTDLQAALDAAALTAWGTITGTLSDQVDLQAALDAAALTAEWGQISGTLGDQTDLQAALDAAAAVATWGGIGGTLSDQTDLQAELDAKANNLVTQNQQTGTAYQLLASDSNVLLSMDNAAANVITVPLNATEAIPVNTRVELSQFGAGQTSIAAEGGVTINSKDSLLALTGQWSGATLTQTAADVWLLVGDLA